MPGGRAGGSASTRAWTRRELCSAQMGDAGHSISADYSRSLLTSLVRAINRLLGPTTGVAVLAIGARISGRGQIVLLGGNSVNLSFLALALPAVTGAHFWLGMRVRNELAELREQEMHTTPDGPSSLLPHVPGLGWYTHGLLPRTVDQSGRVAVAWRDPSVQFALLSCLLCIAGFAPWEIRRAMLAWTLPTALAVIISGAVVLLVGINWRIGARWITLLAELQAAPSRRTLTHRFDQEYDATGDSGLPLVGITIGVGGVIMVIGYALIAAGLVALALGLDVPAAMCGLAILVLGISIQGWVRPLLLAVDARLKQRASKPGP